MALNGPALDSKESTFDARNYLRNNVALSSSEVAVVRDALMRTRAEIARLDSQTGNMDAEETQRERLSLVRSLDEHEALVAPIRRCPPEILSSIFRFVVFHSSDFSSMGAPVQLGRVCHHWRQVTIATAQLWACLQVHLTSEACTLLSTTWLARSSKCPLVLGFYWNATRHTDSQADAQERLRVILELLTAEQSRISTMYVWIPTWFFPAFSVFHGGLPAVSAVELIVNYPLVSTPGYKAHLADFFARFPRLERASLLGGVQTIFDVSLRLPWQQLTSLRFGQCELDDIRFILKHCPSLLQLFVSSFGVANLDEQPPVCHASLRMLNVCLYANFNIFPTCTLPSLTDLTIVNTAGFHFPPVTPSIVAFLERSQCRLKKFSLAPTARTLLLGLKPWEWHFGDVPTLLRYMSAVEELDISDHLTERAGYDILPLLIRGQQNDSGYKSPGITSSAEDDAASHDDNLSVLPELRVLTLSYKRQEPAELDDYWQGQLRRMLHSRSRHRDTLEVDPPTGNKLVSLERVRVHFNHMPSLATLEQLKELFDAGMDVSVLVDGVATSLWQLSG
ncbi:hypothetical protein PLICRDRAFT_559074 [Plicaturopsis crispa FD-325 SS-3]|nr:hypothetical protein PLICRDRAFT_559074 [Plicaturopsis crispa FD-325 SS-3]